MSAEERRAWIMLVTSIGGYAAYLAIILNRASATPLTEVAYVKPLLWSIGGAIIASIVLTILLAIRSRVDIDQVDQRDREIGRRGEYIGQSLVIAGAIAALLMAMAEMKHFWIANTIYLSFVLSAVLASIAKIVFYRKGFAQW